MYNLIILLTDPQANFAFGFKTEDVARAAREKVKAAMKNNIDGIFTLTDDYDQTVDCSAKSIATVFLQCQKSKCAIADDQNIDQARNNAEFMKRRNEDMELMRLFPGNNLAQGRA